MGLFIFPALKRAKIICASTQLLSRLELLLIRALTQQTLFLPANISCVMAIFILGGSFPSIVNNEFTTFCITAL